MSADIRFERRHPNREAAIEFLRNNPTFSTKAAAERFGVSPKTIRNWRRRHFATTPITIGRDGVTRRNPSYKSPASDIGMISEKLLNALDAAEKQIDALAKDSEIERLRRIDKEIHWCFTELIKRALAKRNAGKGMADFLKGLGKQTKRKA